MSNWLDKILARVRLTPPTPPTYDTAEYGQADWGRRLELGCIDWAQHGYGAPLSVYGVYALKIVLYIYGWVFFCGFSPGMGELTTIDQWYHQDTNTHDLSAKHTRKVTS